MGTPDVGETLTAVPKMTWALAALSLVAATGYAAPKTSADPAAAVAAERALAARAGEIGVAPSFLEYMTDDAIVFSPDPLLAKAVYSVQAPPKLPKDGGTLLNWWPNFAGVARSGDLAFTTGPATINGGKPGIFYFTVWVRQKDGGWKWIFDGGVDADGASAPGPDAVAAHPAARRHQAARRSDRHGSGAHRRDRARHPRQG